MGEVLKSKFNGLDYLYVGADITSFIASTLVDRLNASFYAIVTDSNVAPIYLDEFASCLSEAAHRKHRKCDNVISYVIPAGELSKNRRTKESIEDWAFSNKCNRNTCFIALGGGVVGDLVGYTASTYMRGVPVVQVPTTLLSMVDSSIGGKTGVNSVHGKNLIGTFHQPTLVFVDLKYLRTLPKHEITAGFGEIIKCAVTFSSSDFAMLEQSSARVLKSALNLGVNNIHNNRLLMEIVFSAACRKIAIISKDEKESGGLRELLNFGHTFGHAIEKQFMPLLPHGVCVAIGCVYEAEISRDLGHLSDIAVGRLIRCVRSYGLPAYITDSSVPEEVVKIWKEEFTSIAGKITKSMMADKKSTSSNCRIVLLSDIGETLESRAVDVSINSIMLALSPSVKIFRDDQIDGTLVLEVPGSKSISNRALVLASLGRGNCSLHGILRSDDVWYMIGGLEKVMDGVKFSWQSDVLNVTKEASDQISGQKEQGPLEVFVGNSGTASRFLTAIVAICTNKDVIISGNERMSSRPVGDLVDSLVTSGVVIEYLGNVGSLPIRIHPSGSNKTSMFRVSSVNIISSESSQFASALLMCSPYAECDLEININSDKITSQSYTDMTLAMMKIFGASVDTSDKPMRYKIKKGYYTNPEHYYIEGDASSAAFPLALAASAGYNVTVKNVGSRSLQGDASFAPCVLRKMGAIVTQTEVETTVKGPADGLLLPLGSIDMNKWTDSFLVTAAVAALAQPIGDLKSTRITGIENQRVKECNRIRVMVDQLSKFGVNCVEHEDGIEIFGTHKSNLYSPAFPGCRCYDDHRIAMSLSVLACSLGKCEYTVISEKRCVEKTWPSWWSVLSSFPGVTIEGSTYSNQELFMIPDSKITIDGDNLQETQYLGPKFPSIEWQLKYGHSFPPIRDFQGIKSVILIGFSGTGKTHLGKMVSRITNLNFVDMDLYFTDNMKLSIPDFINIRGWDTFRHFETVLLKEVITKYSKGAIIACGGGIVVTDTGRSILKQFMEQNGGIVIHIWANMKKYVIPAILVDDTRPVYPWDADEEWDRRAQHYGDCSNYEFYNLWEDACITREVDIIPPQTSAMRLARIIHFASTSVGGTGRKSGSCVLSARLPPMEYRSYFVCIKVKNVEVVLSDLDTILSGASAVELRVDCLDSYATMYVSHQLALLRTYTLLPIIFTLRSVSHSGNFPDDLAHVRKNLLSLAIRQGCEIVDVEYDGVSKSLFDINASNRPRSLIMSSYHDEKDLLREIPGDVCSPLSVLSCEKMYMNQKKSSDIVKLVISCRNLADNLNLGIFRHQAEFAADRVSLNKPLILFAMGSPGRYSRLRNTFLSPVTHEKLPEAAAKGQFSIKLANRLCHSLGMLPKKFIYLFGEPIHKSPSPLIFNAAFRTLGLPYEYKLYPTSDCNRVKEFIRERIADGTFGGASVTIPLKVECIANNLCQKLSPNVIATGSLNTLYMDNDGPSAILTGDNTDFIGIEAVLRRFMLIRSVDRSVDIIGVVIGAGGTARAAICALRSTGCTKIYIWNRTPVKALDLANSFGIDHAQSIHDIRVKVSESGVCLIVGTIPSHAQKPYSADISSLVQCSKEGCVVEMAYGEVTELISAAKATKGKWDYVDGLTVLVEQASYQFKIFTQHLGFPSICREIIAGRCDISRRELNFPL